MVKKRATQIAIYMAEWGLIPITILKAEGLKKTSAVEQLIELHTDCEVNFARLRKLMPSLEKGDSRRFLAGSYDEAYLHIEVVESDRYTRFVHLSGCMGELPWEGEQRMAVRVYLDASMAEVISCGAERVRLLRYPYPNDQMYSRDEKNQINRFLGKWLNHFIRHGHPVKADYQTNVKADMSDTKAELSEVLKRARGAA